MKHFQVKNIEHTKAHQEASKPIAFQQVDIRLAFHNISYHVAKPLKGYLRFTKAHHERKTILHDISGVVEPGDMVALMGSSGAGKSTLLNVLSRRIISNEGTVLLNNVSADMSPTLRASCCYIQQEDLFFRFITVKEHLEQQGALRLCLSKDDIKKRVNEIIQRFSLDKVRDSQIGDVAQGSCRGISGGEKKRLSVATELLINPKLIFADEPTSGLDAFMAYSVMEILKLLSNINHTVVTTIHQPSSDVFSLFNKLLLLAEGKVIFYGPRLAAIAYFLKLGYPCPPYTNPADHFIELVSIDWENPTNKLAEIDRWAVTWKQCSQSFTYEWETELKEKFTASLTSDFFATECPPVLPSNNQEMPFRELTYSFQLECDALGNLKRPPWYTVASALLRRTFLSNSRNPSVMRARLIQTIVTALLGGLVYLRLSETSTHSKSGACFFMLVNLGFMMTFSAITTFMSDKTIVLRERDTGLYSLGMYFWVKIINDLLFQFHLPIVYCSISWYMMGINDNFLRFIVATLFIQLMSFSISSIGYIVASFSKNIGVAVSLGPVLLLPLLMVSGFVIQKPSLPVFWVWLYHISPFVYGFSGLMRAAFLNVEFKSVPSPENDVPSEATLLFSSGNEVLRYFSIEDTQYRWIVDVFVLLTWIVLGRIIAMMLFVASNKRRK